MSREKVSKNRVFCRVDYKVKITGESPLLINDNSVTKKGLVDWRNQHKKELEEHLMKNNLVFDDRVPPFAWYYCFYMPTADCDEVVVPYYVLEAALRSASKILYRKRIVPFDTFKKFYFTMPYYPVLVNGTTLKLNKLYNPNLSYEDQKKLASGFGIELFEANLSFRGGIGVRVRPRIKNWEINFGVSARLNLENDSTNIDDLMVKLFEVAGSQCGICDWRPSSPRKKGVHGVFSAKLTRTV